MKNQKQFKTYIGVDLGDRRHQICVTDKDGNIESEKKIENTREDLALLATDYSEALVAMEVGTHSPWISRYLQSLGMTVVVANPRKVKYISLAGQAENLGFLGKGNNPLQQMLGHKELSTREIYTQASIQELKEIQEFPPAKHKKKNSNDNKRKT